MLSLTRKTDYALIALTHLAQDLSGCCSAREIATRYRIPLPLLMNVLKQLTQRGLARSVRGPRGGYTLAMAPNTITLNDVVRAIEGPIQLVQCVPSHEAAVADAKRTPCDLASCCPIRSPVHLIHDRLVRFLDGVTLADVAIHNGCCSAAQPADILSGVTSSEEVDLPG